MEREEACAAIPLPGGMSAPLAGYEWARDNVGESGCAVYRLYGKPDAPDLFLKHGYSSVANDVTDEMVRLRWLARRIPVPAFKGFVAKQDEAWLLMTALPGQTAYQFLETRPDAHVAIVDALAAFLRRIAPQYAYIDQWWKDEQSYCYPWICSQRWQYSCSC